MTDLHNSDASYYPSHSCIDENGIFILNNVVKYTYVIVIFDVQRRNGMSANAIYTKRRDEMIYGWEN